MLTDTHAHLYWDSFKEDLDQVIKSALDVGVSTIINAGVDVELSKKAAEMDSGQARMTFYSSIGIHPHEAWKYRIKNHENTPNSKMDLPRIMEQDVAALEDIYYQNTGKVVAVGECGLDFLFENNPDFIPSSLSEDDQKNLQRELFLAQINLAKKLNLPILVHVRDDRSQNPNNTECWNEAIDLSKDHFGIYHCYSGMPETTQRILGETNFLISFAGNLTYPQNDYLREALKIIPLERIVLETDSPFLPPQSIRGKRNEPSSVKEIASLVSEIKGIPLEQVAKQTTENFHTLIDPSSLHSSG